MPSLDRLNKGYQQRVRKLSKVFGEADLTAGATSEALSLGTVPAGAYVLGVRVALATAFTGGGSSSVVLDIGTADDADAIRDGIVLHSAAVDGEASTATAGIAPNKGFAAATELLATFISNVNVSALTAGACTVEVLYAVAGL